MHHLAFFHGEKNTWNEYLKHKRIACFTFYFLAAKVSIGSLGNVHKGRPMILGHFGHTYHVTMCKKIQMQLQNLIKHQIFTFIARYRRVICGWNVHFGNKASSWCTDRGGPLILDDVILLFVLRILQLKLFQSNFDSYFRLHIFWDWRHSIQTNTEVFVFETFVPENKKKGTNQYKTKEKFNKITLVNVPRQNDKE